MSGPDLVTDLERAARAIESLPDSGARDLLQLCVSELLAGNDPRPRLGLPKITTQSLRLARRDYWLREAYKLLPPTADRSRCEALESEAIRFEASAWIRWRNIERPPDGASPLLVCLFNARKEGSIPGWRQLFSICVMNRRSNCTNTEST